MRWRRFVHLGPGGKFRSCRGGVLLLLLAAVGEWASLRTVPVLGFGNLSHVDQTFFDSRSKGFGDHAEVCWFKWQGYCVLYLPSGRDIGEQVFEQVRAVGYMRLGGSSE